MKSPRGRDSQRLQEIMKNALRQTDDLRNDASRREIRVEVTEATGYARRYKLSPEERDRRIDAYIKAFEGTEQEFSPEFERVGIEAWLAEDSEKKR
jgi:hypothetical protein